MYPYKFYDLVFMLFYELNIPQQKANHKIESVVQLSYFKCNVFKQ